MFPILIYTAVAALAVLVPQAIQPTDALRDDHHRGLYWTGALAAIGMLCAVGAIFLL
ncbi:hypothetical protein [Kaistia hirudinis]|nr:hypothetical protein [Kaistia hirudinis]